MVLFSEEKLNANPIIKQIKRTTTRSDHNSSPPSPSRDLIDSEEVFELIRNIRDPEHPLTLEELGVVSLEATFVDDVKKHVKVFVTPTIAHCSMISLIGLCVKIQLMRLLPEQTKITVLLEKGTHVQEAEVNKQLADKERIAAAMENTHLVDMMYSCISAVMQDPHVHTSV